MEQVQYTNMVFDDLYQVLTKDKNPWPKNYTRARKVKLLDEMEVHFRERDEYEKCKMILEIRSLIMKSK